MGPIRGDEWIVLPDPENEGMDRIVRLGRVVGKILWLRELRYPSMCRVRMSAALNDHPVAGIDDRIRPLDRVPRGHCWTADGANKVWLLQHNGVTIAELHSAATGAPAEFIRDGVLVGLNMRPGRRPEACEPMPVTPVVERHLRLVR